MHSVGWQIFSCVIFTFHDFGSFFLDFPPFFFELCVLWRLPGIFLRTEQCKTL